jgi:ferredoxin
MPKVTVEGVGEFTVPENKRLVLALVDEAGTDQLYACGGNARCTTCRVEFVDGEPETMTVAEKTVLVQLISRLEGSGRIDAGKRPTDALAPTPVEWTTR